MNEKTTVRSREMGVELRARREEKELTLREIARRADWSAGKVSAWENGRRITTIDAAIYLAHCDTGGAERHRLLELTKPPGDLYWVRPYFDPVADPARSLLIQENLATSIVYHSPAAVPGMLQTEEYVRALDDLSGRYPAERLRPLVTTRADRQLLLQRASPPMCTFFVYEHALRAVLRDHRLMHEQLQYLVFATNLPCCLIRVIPMSAPPFHATAGTFTLMEFPDHPAVVYEETFSAGLFVEEQAAIEAFRLLVARLDQYALPARESRQLLARLTDDYERRGL